MTDPKGVQLCMGQTTLQVDFSKVNFDIRYKDLTSNNFLFMGTIAGRVAVTDVNQQSNSPTWNNLYLVTLLGNGKASFSGLDQDVIAVQGKDLTNFINKSSELSPRHR